MLTDRFGPFEAIAVASIKLARHVPGDELPMDLLVAEAVHGSARSSRLGHTGYHHQHAELDVEVHVPQVCLRAPRTCITPDGVRTPRPGIGGTRRVVEMP